MLIVRFYELYCDERPCLIEFSKRNIPEDSINSDGGAPKLLEHSALLLLPLGVCPFLYFLPLRSLLSTASTAHKFPPQFFYIRTIFTGKVDNNIASFAVHVSMESNFWTVHLQTW